MKRYFRNSVEIPDDTLVLTNPENQLTVNTVLKQHGISYIKFRTIFNWIRMLL